MMYAEGNFLGSSSSSDNESGYDDSPDDDDDVGATVITVNGKILTADEATRRLGNIQIGSGRCMVVGAKPKWEHKRHHERTRKEKAKEKPTCHIVSDPTILATKGDFDIVANDIGKDWKKLAKQLGFTRGMIEAISIDFHAEGTYEQAYQSLLKWNRRETNRAKLVDLVNALKEVGFEDLCSKLGKGNR